MAVETYAEVMKWVRKSEGGYINHPKDPGGATNMGVTQRVYNAYRRVKRYKIQPVKKITEDEVSDIYKKQYADKIKYESLPAGLDYAVLDFAINSGTGRAAKFLQRIVGVQQDGDIGQITLAAVRAESTTHLIRMLCTERYEFLKGLKHWPTFKNGWTRRVMGEVNGAQVTDIGVIDRSIMLYRKYAAGDTSKLAHIPEPNVLPTERSAKGRGNSTALTVVKNSKEATGAITGIVGVAAAAIAEVAPVKASFMGLVGDTDTAKIIGAVVAVAALAYVIAVKIKEDREEAKHLREQVDYYGD